MILKPAVVVFPLSDPLLAAVQTEVGFCEVVRTVSPMRVIIVEFWQIAALTYSFDYLDPLPAYDVGFLLQAIVADRLGLDVVFF